MNLSQNEGAPTYRHDDAALNMVHTVEFWALVRSDGSGLAAQLYWLLSRVLWGLGPRLHPTRIKVSHYGFHLYNSDPKILKVAAIWKITAQTQPSEARSKLPTLLLEKPPLVGLWRLQRMVGLVRLELGTRNVASEIQSLS